MKEVLIAVALLGAAALVIGFAIETMGRASRRDARHRNQDPPTITRWVEPEEGEWWTQKDTEREILVEARQPRGRINRDKLN